MFFGVLILFFWLGLFLEIFLFLFDLGITVFRIFVRIVLSLPFNRSFFNVLMVDTFIDVLFVGNNLSFFLLRRWQGLGL